MITVTKSFLNFLPICINLCRKILLRKLRIIVLLVHLAIIHGFAQDASIPIVNFPNNKFTAIPIKKFTIDSIDKDKFVVSGEPAQESVLSNKHILESLLKKYKNQKNINFRVLVARTRYAGNQIEDYTKAFNVATEASQEVGEKCILIIYFKGEKRVYVYPSISYQKQLSSDYLDSLLVRNFIEKKYPDEYVAIGHLCLDLVETINDDFIVDSLDERTGRFWGYLHFNFNGEKFNSHEPPSPLMMRFPNETYKLRPAVEDGNLNVIFTINTDGTIKDIVYALKGDRINELYLKNIFTDWKFIPAMENGIPCIGKISLNFDIFANSNYDTQLNSIKVDNSTNNLVVGSSYNSDITKFDRIPTATVQVHPAIPYEMRSKGISGEFLVRYTVTDKGDVENASVVRVSYWIQDSKYNKKPVIIDDSEKFDYKKGEANISYAVSRWKFKPAIKNGVPVSFTMESPIVITTIRDE